jgi:hypothetical protein
VENAISELEQKFLQLITPLPAEFQTAGLVLREQVNKNDALGFSTWFIFQNTSSQVVLTIVVSPFGVDIVSIDGGKGRHFLLDDYLQYHGREAEKKTLFTLSRDLDAFLEYLRKIIANEWLDIIQGKRWEDIPFDWMGYK